MGTARKGDEAIFSRGRTYYVEGVGILFDWGETVPADGTADYAIGAIFQHVDVPLQLACTLMKVR